ncbi:MULTISPECIES: Hachiman antiphage defense system protein HamA [unclassified Pseudoalteromonas]|uniref:Hachiman antiphage defense system protein HamA n=1 Tax=unclassified Pseudoalteromonas TaxID=194690 RepID=UPI0003FFC4B6|nr:MULTISPECIES: Hachiman antiphage defense system protein HamA [unclassified Pseudoalteromonas]
MLGVENKSLLNEQSRQNHKFNVLNLKPSEFNKLKDALIGILPGYYVDPQSMAGTLARLGKDATARKLLTKIPEVKNIRSGDIGEVLASDYIEESLGYSVPIRKLRWRDHRNMAMRGDDVIGIIVDQQQQSIKFLKAEAKANRTLGRGILGDARKELDLDDGFPAPHALEFVAERLRETGNQALSNLIEKVQLVDGIRANQVEHLLFTFTASNPATLQKEAFDAYNGNIKQTSVGFRVTAHQELIAGVYQGVIDGLND